MNKYGSSMESLWKTMLVQMFKICIWNKQYMLHKTEQNMLFLVYFESLFHLKVMRGSMFGALKE